MNFDFLKNVSVAAAVTTVRRQGEAKTYFPTNGADLRIYKSGAIYPSQALVEKYGLEYGPRTGEKKEPSGHGMDVVDSRHWAQAAGLPQPMIFVAAVPRKEGKVDLFASVAYDAEGHPKSSVLAQGAETAGKELLELAKEIYGVEIDPEVGYLDLKVMDHLQPLASPNGIYNLPKKISRGERAGEISYERRENLSLFALVPFELVKDQLAAATAEATAQPAYEPAEEAYGTDVPVAPQEESPVALAHDPIND